MSTRSNTWNALIQAKNLQQLTIAATIFDKSKVTRAVKYAISDSSATGHFLVEGALVVNKRVAENPITITLHNIKVVQSTHTWNLDIPWLPHQVNGGPHCPRVSACISHLNMNILWCQLQGHFWHERMQSIAHQWVGTHGRQRLKSTIMESPNQPHLKAHSHH